MGKALSDGYRQNAFLMTKVDGRTKTAATAQLNESLRKLQTDRIDLLQFHEVIRDSDPERVFAVGGAMEAVLEAKKAGKVRFIGFTGDKSPDRLENAGHGVTACLQFRCRSDASEFDGRTLIECLHYPMNLPTSVVITGCDSMPILQQALQAARNFQPLDSSQITALLAKTSKAAETGEFELYKRSHHFDGTYANPQWLG
jgi:hypothetical protein